MKTEATFLFTLLILAAAIASPAPAPAPGRHAFNVMGESIGVVGYDPVSYFPEGGGKPMKGSIQIAHSHEGVTYRFANEENRERFKKNPSRYLPLYGGWCAWAVAELGKRVDVDPESYALRGGKLYLFYRDPGLDTRAMWLPEADEMIRKADANWPGLAR